MLRSLYTAATGMDAQQLRMDLIANNLANTNTSGFKKARAEFEDLLSETIRGTGSPTPQGNSEPAPLQVGLGVRTGSTTRTFSQGDMINTQNPLDLAIEGAGFFRVQRPNGETAYSRAGNFRIDGAGRLTTQNGAVVEPGISIPADASQITIRSDGTITAMLPNRQEAIELGILELATFQNPGGLLAIGHNLFASTPSSGEAILARPGENGMGSVAQGFLEGANVKAVEEMIDMISTQRAYELNSKVIQTADQMLQKLTSMR